MKFTDKTLQALVSSGKRHYIRSEHQGFVVRVQPSGLKTFFFIQTVNGKRKHKNLGNYGSGPSDVSLNSALAEYFKCKDKDNHATEAQEEQPQDEEDHAADHSTFLHTFLHWHDLYLTWSKAKHSEAWHSILKLSLANDVLPVWSNKRIQDIRRVDVIQLLEAVALRSPGQTSNVHKGISGVFEYALQRDALQANPAMRLHRTVPTLSDIPRQRVLSPREVKTIWVALNDSKVERALKVILCTAQRPGEVAGLLMHEIQDDVWTIPPERAEKAHRTHHIPLPETAKQLIPPDGFGITRHALSKYLCRNNYLGLPRWTPHDLRRTARTYFAKLGIQEEVSEAILNHSKKGMSKIYNQYMYFNEKREALLQWEAELHRMVST